MQTISIAFAGELAADTSRLSTCWRAERTDGVVLGFTDHNRDLTVDGLVYEAAAGYTSTEIGTSSELNADLMELRGLLASPSITEDDLRAGLWDHASIAVFQVCWDDLTKGIRHLRVGHLGEVSLERGQFQAEMRGLLQYYSTSIGELTSPGCRANLGDERCRVDLTPFTVTSTITGVNADGVTLYDTARTEPGPVGGVDIIDVSNSNPGVVTTDGPHGFSENQQISISGVVGPESINVVTLARHITEDTFQLSVDTSNTTDYPPYVSGGVATPFGDSGYFDGGLLTFNTGANAGIGREVKAYAPGQISMFLPFPYQVHIGDEYTMQPGCDKSLATCRDRYNNIVNMRAEPYLPGIDRLIQQGRHK